MVEIGCNDGITNDWPQMLSQQALDTNADWHDVDCYFNWLGGSVNPYLQSLRARYR
jgi:hypothetical protein